MNTHDTENLPAVIESPSPKRKRSWSAEEKSAMIKEIDGSSVAAVARKYGLGANQLRSWRKQMDGQPDAVEREHPTDPRATCEAQLLRIEEHQHGLNLIGKKLIGDLNSGKGAACNIANAYSGVVKAYCALASLTNDTVDRLSQLPKLEEKTAEEFENPDIKVQKEAERWVYAFVKAECDKKDRIARGLPPDSEEEYDDDDSWGDQAG